MRPVLVLPEHLDPALRARPMLVTSPDLASCEDLPAAVTCDGTIISRWELTDVERRMIANGAHVYVFVWTGGNKLQPISTAVGP